MTDPVIAQTTEPKSKVAWKALGYRVLTKCRPADFEYYSVPRYSTVTRERYPHSVEQVVAIDPKDAERRSILVLKAIETRKKNLQDKVLQAELTIEAGLSDEEIRLLARRSHGGNY